MTIGSLSSKSLKYQAKQLLFRHQKAYLMASGLYMVLAMVVALLQEYLPGTSPLYLLYSSVEEYSLATGVWSLDAPSASQFIQAIGGVPEAFAQLGAFLGALRVEEAGQVWMIFLPYGQLPSAIFLQILFLVLTAPMLLALLHQLWGCYRGEPKPLKQMLNWYLDLRLAGRSILLQLGLSLFQLVLSLITALPALILLVVACTTEGGLNESLLMLVLPLSCLGSIAAYTGYCLCMPVRYLLAEQPQQGIIAAVKGTLALLKGQWKAFLLLQMTFIPFQIVGLFSYGVMDLYLIPYQAMTNFLFFAHLRGEAIPETRPAMPRL